MKQTAIFVLISLFAQLNLWAQKTRTDSLQQAVCPVVKIQPEQLPSLNTPRSGHHTLYVNGEITVFGGHTSGFVPTPTAEYFKDGAWHQMDMVYTHDAGAALILKSGKVLLSGSGSHDRELAWARRCGGAAARHLSFRILCFLGKTGGDT